MGDCLEEERCSRLADPVPGLHPTAPSQRCPAAQVLGARISRPLEGFSPWMSQC